MPKFLNGDVVKYIASEYEGKEGKIAGIKVRASEYTGRPIYYIIWKGEEQTFKYGIHEGNLRLIKRKEPDWRA